MVTEEYISLAEAAELLGKSKETLRRWDRDGKLEAVREPITDYRVYKKSDILTLFGDFISDTDSTALNQVEPAHTYKVLELFAGAGGLAIGMEKAGFKCVALNEIDKFACQTLRFVLNQMFKNKIVISS